jgi:PEGA domain-containing protein
MLPTKFRVATLLGLMFSQSILLAQEKGKIARPVDDAGQPFGTSTLQADYGTVWQMMTRILGQHGFDFVVRNRDLGRIETNYIVFSRHPEFSKLSGGVKSLAKTPRIFLKKWMDGRIRLFVEMHSQEQGATRVILRPDIYGFASTLSDDSGVTGEWRQCVSNGKFEFELFNEVATALRKLEGSSQTNTLPAKDVKKIELPAGVESQLSGTVVLTSVPEGAEIFLDGELVGMTPSRLKIPAGSRRLSFRKRGFKDYEKVLVILQDSDLTIGAELEAR